MISYGLHTVFRHRFLFFALAVGLSVFGAFFGPKLPLNLSISKLLPENRTSVVEMNHVADYVGGVGFLVLIIGPTQNPEQHLLPLSEQLKKYPGINYVFFEKEEYTLKDKALYLLPKKDFRKLSKNVRVLFGSSSGGLGLLSKEEEEENARKFLKELKEKTQSQQNFISNDGQYAMLLAKPKFNSEDLKASQKLITYTQLVAKELLGPNIPFRLAGRFADKVRDTQQIQSDIAKTGAISFFGLAFVLLWGLGSLRSTLVTLSGVIISLGWTTGLAKLVVGQINILTGFLLAILGGLGVEYGVHLIRRYEQEISTGLSRKEALKATYITMGRTLFSAAITSASAFLILSMSDFRGFSELGKIAGLGVLSIYFSYIFCFPTLGILLKDRPRFGKTRSLFGLYWAKKSWALPTLLATLVLLFSAPLAEFEYDFARMHRLSQESTQMNQLSQELFGKSMTPAALLAKDRKQATKVQDWLLRDENSNIIQNAISINTILPSDMKSRSKKIGKLNKEVQKISDQEITDKTGIAAAQVRNWLSQSRYQLSDLPEPFPSTFGVSERIVYAYPKESLNQAQPLRRFTNTLQEARTNFPGTEIGSDATVFVEILEHIIADGKLVLLLFLVGSFFVFWLDFKSLFGAAILELQLIFGMALLAGLMALLGERFSILNVAMIPAVLAAGIDIGVHVRHRELEGHSPLAAARYIAQAVQLSVITTMIGFGALFFAEAGILRGIAWISVLGQFSMYLICMIIVPVLKEAYWPQLRSLLFSKSLKTRDLK